MPELPAETEREIHRFLEKRAREEDDRRARFFNKVLAVAGLLLGAIIAMLSAAFYFFVDSVENKAMQVAEAEARHVVENTIGAPKDIISARAKIVAAELQVVELRDRTETMLEHITQKRNEINKQASRIDALKPLFGITADLKSLKNALADDESFKEEIAGDLNPAPSGLIAAYNSNASIDDTEKQCPKGWSPFGQANGRVIVGAGQAKSPISTRGPHSEGGAEKVVLTEAEMPTHTHATSFKVLKFGNNGEHGFTHPVNEPHGFMPTQKVEAAGQGGPHENMPPYIALYFCVKN